MLYFQSNRIVYQITLPEPVTLRVGSTGYQGEIVQTMMNKMNKKGLVKYKWLCRAHEEFKPSVGNYTGYPSPRKTTQAARCLARAFVLPCPVA